MAIFNHGIFSKAKNKLGGVTFQQYEGMQIGKEYQPNVKNPNTTAQQHVRARFKLASQFIASFSSVFTVFGGNISAYTRISRGNILKRIFNVTSWDDEMQYASMTPSDAIAAVNSALSLPVVETPTIAGTAIANATVAAPNGSTVYVNIVAIDEEGNRVGARSYSQSGSGIGQAVIAPITAVTPSYYDITAVATYPDTENGNTTYGNIDDMSQVEVSTAVNSGNINTSQIAYARIPQSA